MTQLNNSKAMRGADSDGVMYYGSESVSVDANPFWVRNQHQPCIVLNTSVRVTRGRSRVAVLIDTADFQAVVASMFSVDKGATLKAFGDCLACMDWQS